MSRNYVTDALEAVIEDITGFVMRVPMSAEFESFFDEDQLFRFKELVRSEFSLDSDVLVESCQSFRELVALLQDELFS